jgi:hypothetical protein
MLDREVPRRRLKRVGLPRKPQARSRAPPEHLLKRFGQVPWRLNREKPHFNAERGRSALRVLNLWTIDGIGWIE